MPVFSYTALNKDGKIIKASYTALDRGQFYRMLRDNQYRPVDITEAKEKMQLKEISLFDKISVRDLAIYCRQFATMLSAGVTIIRTLNILSQQSENKKLAKTSSELFEALQKGATFSDALRQHKKYFPEIMINMVEAGEASGTLDNVMDRLSAFYEKESKTGAKVKTAMVYPAALGGLSVLVVIFMLTFVMPTFTGMFTSSGVELPGVTKVLLGISDGIRSYWYIIISIIAAVIYIFTRYTKSDKGRFTMDSFKLTLPLLKGINQKTITARFTRIMATLLSSGVPLLQSMDILIRVVGNKVVEEGLKNAKEEIRKGRDIATPIQEIGVFPPMVHSMINIGEESGTLDNMLLKTADFYDEELEIEVQRLVTLLEPLLIISMALVIGFIVIAMLLPMFDMMKTVQ